MTNWTPDQYNEYLQNQIRDKRNRQRALYEERKNDPVEPAKNHDRPKEASLDGEGHQQFNITITWHVSDRRRRDAWGMSETIADCIVSAVRRFYGLHDTRKARKKVRIKRSRGM